MNQRASRGGFHPPESDVAEHDRGRAERIEAVRAPARSAGSTMVWGGQLSVARRSLNGAGVETRTGCRASRCRGPLRLPCAAVPVTRGPTREARRRRPQVPRQFWRRAPDHRLRLPGAAVPGASGANQGSSYATGWCCFNCRGRSRRRDYR